MRVQGLVVAALVCPVVALAQDSLLAPGARIRVQAPQVFRGSLIATVMSIDSDSARAAVSTPDVSPLRPDAVRYYWISPANASRIDVSMGRSRWGSIRRGAVVGGIACLVAFVGWAAALSAGGDDDFGYAILYVGPIVASTAVTGFFVGGDKWPRVYSTPR